MKAVTPAQMAEIDRFCINKLGIPGVVLMENAALKVVEETVGYLGRAYGKNILVFAGKGNNGGDAFAAARHLFNRGAKVKVYVLADKKSVSGDAAVFLNILEQTGIQVKELNGEVLPEGLTGELEKAEVVIDGIFGTGIKGNVEGMPAEVIRLINASGKPVISIDIPSGVSGETGRVLGCCIKAVKTVTFGLPKIGLLIHPGCEFAGDVVVADIGIPEKALKSVDITTQLIDPFLVSKVIPERFENSNKGDYGKIFIISGSAGMTGAGCLAAGAALRVGAGLVYLGVPSSLTAVYDVLLKESVTVPIDDEGKGRLSAKHIGSLLENLEGKDVAVIGPGLSTDDDVAIVIHSVIKNVRIPIVIDADGLNAISRDLSVLKNLKAEAVVTPHPGEMARLAGISVKDVQDNRIGIAREFALRWGVITVLKGSKTVVALPDGTLYLNPTGNSGMATGGMGDVLAGVIAGLAGQGVKLAEASVAGVYIHGLAGDRVAERKGKHGMIAGDVLEELPYTIRELKAAKQA